MNRLKHLCDLVESPVSASDLKLRPDLKLLLLLFKVHQVPLVLQTGLTPFPELQKQSYCQTGFEERKCCRFLRMGVTSTKQTYNENFA